MGQGTDSAELGWRQGGKGGERGGRRGGGVGNREGKRAREHEAMILCLLEQFTFQEKKITLWHQGLLALTLYIVYSYYLQFLIAVHATSGVCIRVDLLRYFLQRPVVTDALGSSAPV